MSKETSGVLIVGGGPVGLATAVMLRRRGWGNITVVEKRPQSFDSERSYMYLLEGRGQRLTDLLGLTPEMAKVGVPIKEFTNLTYVLPTGKTRVFQFPWAAVSSQEKFYLPRQEMVNVLMGAIEQMKIPILFDCSADSIIIDHAANAVHVRCLQRTVSGEKVISFTPRVIIGCDGYQSSIRDFLVNSGLPDCAKFSPKTWQADSGKLRYKILRISGQFPLPSETGDFHQRNASVPSRGYVFVGVNGDSKSRIRLGLLPVRSASYRTANVICDENHVIWRMDSKDEVKEFLSQSLPQMNPITDYFSDLEIARFANIKPGKFPMPSSVSKCQLQVANACTFLLAGDAVHSFPPDTGQGINSGFLDVHHLYEALEETSDDFVEAAKIYERVVIPESKALAEIVSYASTSQYGIAPVKRFFNLLNFKLRDALSKLLPGVFSQAAFYLIQNPSLTYSEINRLAKRTTRRILAIPIFIWLIAFITRKALQLAA